MSVVEAILAVFTSIGTWFISTMQSFVPIFYTAEDGLTFFGVLSVASLGIALILLFLNIVKDFVKWRA